jgi:hypothetical protein
LKKKTLVVSRKGVGRIEAAGSRERKMAETGTRIQMPKDDFLITIP